HKTETHPDGFIRITRVLHGRSTMVLPYIPRASRRASDKCGDAFIVEENPHIHDPDDVFPGLVIKITPSRSSDAASSLEEDCWE
nr:peptidoglycan-binding LysM domain-containing protein [Tanacetum cinerariifolium]